MCVHMVYIIMINGGDSELELAFFTCGIMSGGVMATHSASSIMP